MSGLGDRISGRLKKAAGDLVDDENLRRQGENEERKATAKDELSKAQRDADLKAEEVARLERESRRRPGDEHQNDPSGPGSGPDPGGRRSS